MSRSALCIVTSICICVCFISFAFTEPIEFLLKDGTVYKGDTELLVKVATNRGGKIGNIIEVSPYNIKLKQQTGRTIDIDKEYILSISEHQVDKPSPKKKDPSPSTAHTCTCPTCGDIHVKLADQEKEEPNSETIDVNDEKPLPIVYTIPLTGKVGFVCGEDNPNTPWFSDSIVRDCFKNAEKKEIKSVILEISSQGGDMNVANAICDLIKEYRNKFEIIAFPHDAEGPACGIVMTCDSIVAAPNSAVGPDSTALTNNALEKFFEDAGRDFAIATEYANTTLNSPSLLEKGIANRSAQTLEEVPVEDSKIISFKNKLLSMQKKARIACQKVNTDIKHVCHEVYEHKHRFKAEEYCIPWPYQIPDQFTLSELMDELMCRKDKKGKTERYYRDSTKLAKKIREIIVDIRLTADRIVKSNINGTYPFQLYQTSLCAAKLTADFGEEVIEDQKIIDDDPRSVTRVYNLLKPYTRELSSCDSCQ